MAYTHTHTHTHTKEYTFKTSFNRVKYTT